MVVARTKLMIHDDLLRPIPVVILNFTGQKPERFYKEIPDLLASTFRVSEDSIQERKFLWTKGEPEKFKVTWEINKDLDKFSYYWVEIKLEGNTSKGMGSANVSVEGALRTEYPQDTIWEKSLLYEFLRMFWHTFFYTRKRDEYIREGRRIISLFIDNLKKLTVV